MGGFRNYRKIHAIVLALVAVVALMPDGFALAAGGADTPGGIQRVFHRGFL